MVMLVLVFHVSKRLVLKSRSTNRRSLPEIKMIVKPLESEMLDDGDHWRR